MREAPESKRAGGAVFAMALAFALASTTLALARPVPAHAIGEGDYPLEITADVARDGEDVVSVVVPSSISIVVRTSVVDGRIMGVSADAAFIENNRRSYAPVSACIVSVADGTTADGKLLPYVDMTLEGQHEVALVEGEGKRDALFDAIAPGSSEPIAVRVAQKDLGRLVPAGFYSVRATLLISPVEEEGEQR